eukprot:TRINITY_DN14278_c0_g1_i1.p1 TRINITY_DN14278_c0_g1~~TRINITY_DN14278_c0_g1_i1.p1  ORF type:complete len:200 (+),score=47.34 TRINITY_DN14278_c0_g1_i1:76-675(+)
MTRGWRGMVCRVAAVALAALVRAAAEEACSADAESGSCLATAAGDGCAARGFDPAQLSCSTCGLLETRLKEAGIDGSALLQECMGCCQPVVAIERFTSARLTAAASSQNHDQDLHDFIKRKAPFFPSLEVEYLDGHNAAIELEQEGQPDRILRADVSGWTSDHLYQFLSERLEKGIPADGEVKMAAEGAWTAEVQTCPG